MEAAAGRLPGTRRGPAGDAGLGGEAVRTALLTAEGGWNRPPRECCERGPIERRPPPSSRRGAACPGTTRPRGPYHLPPRSATTPPPPRLDLAHPPVRPQATTRPRSQQRPLRTASGSAPPPPLPDQINVVFNWFDELKRRVPVRP